ncbi:MAG: hypothetical protein KDD47_02620, partial [Acidobacteria bacterium]|nr:hypothetical protein [Acidobacteriota bacterium]
MKPATPFEVRRRHPQLLEGLGILALFLLLGAGSAAELRAQSSVARISAAARQQIERVLEDKRSLSPAQKKLDTRLLVEVRSRRGDPGLFGLPAMKTGISLEADGRLLLDLRGEVTAALLAAIRDLGGEVESSFPRWHTLRLRLPLGAVETLAARAEVKALQPAVAMRVEGNTVITEGDVAHRADTARTTFGLDGTGVMACAMSDSVDALADLQASGELPPGVLVLPGQSGNPGTSEGTALLEILHDLAPGADLGFATGQGGPSQMAQNILDLA